MTPVDALLDKLERVKRNGEGWQARCPAHEDKTPSLSVSEGSDGVALVKCHAGCDTAKVLAAVGLQVGDLFPKDDKPTIDTTYDYTDEEENLLLQVVRYDPKGFRQRRPGGPGEPEWVWKAGKVRRPLYRLPEVLAEREHVYVVEGEKDADALAEVGATATTCLGGAGKWRDAYCESLAHAQQVTVVADRDEPGRKHAREVAASLVKGGKVQTVEVVQPPEGSKDISDMLAKGLTKADFEPLDEPEPETPEETPSRRVRLTRVDRIKPKPTRWLWEARLPLGELALTPGRGGIGKSTFHAWLTAQVTTGNLPGEYQGQPRAVIIMTTEDSWNQTVVPRLLAAGADLARVYRADVVTEHEEETTLVLPADGSLLARQIAKVGAVLVSLDPLLSTIDASLDTHKNSEVRQALEPLKALAAATGSTVLGNAHFNKGKGADPLALVTGSGAFGDVPRAVVGFARDDDTGEYVATQVKNNLGRLDLPSLRYTIEEARIPTDEGPTYVGRLDWQGESERTLYDILRSRDDGEKGAIEEAAEWLESVLSDGPLAKSELAKYAKMEGIAERTLQRAREALRIVIDRDESAKGRPSTWRLPDYVPTSGRSEGLARNRANNYRGSSDYVPPRESGTKSLLRGVEDLEPCPHCDTLKPVDAARCWECGKVTSSQGLEEYRRES